MRLLLEHRSRYVYPRPAILGPHLLRLRPAAHAVGSVTEVADQSCRGGTLYRSVLAYGKTCQGAGCRFGESYLRRAGSVRDRGARDERVRRFLEEPRYAVVATIDPDGAPRPLTGALVAPRRPPE